jgi:hypothetical protein
MFTFLVTLHVLAAILVMGPFALGALRGHQTIRRRDASGTRDVARWMAIFSIGTVLVVLLGFAALGLSKRYTFHSPWVIISITLYVVAMGVATGYTVPALRKTARMIDEGVLPVPRATPVPDDETTTTTLSASATDLATKERLDAVAGRVAGSGALVLLCVAVITILMVVRPFGP